MTLEVIGAGFGRTGTMSLKKALERLGFGPCYHMIEVFRLPERVADWTETARSPRPDWDSLFDGYRACVDWPAATYWRALAAHYPDAKVILSMRDAESWFASTQKTIFQRALVESLPPEAREMVDLNVYSLFDGRLDDRERCISVYERHVREVCDSLPPERLLLSRASDGWEPLCAFLGCEIPDEPYPRANQAEDFARLREELEEQVALSPGPGQ